MSSILSIDPANSVLGVADYYAEAARVKLGGQTAEPLTNMTDKRTRTKLLQRTQAELMLALHDWGMGRGNQAYKGLGSAIDSADVLGLSSGPQNPLPARYQEEDRHLMQAYQQRLCPTRFGEEGEEDYVQAEVERRTFWACFVMDCYLGGAQQRRSKIDKEKIPIQLPMSDQSFAFGKNVKTKLLGESRAEFDARYNAELRQHQLLQERKPINEDRTSDMRKNAMQFTSAKGPLIEIEESEGYHAHWIRAVCVFGKVLAWSCRGGRRTGNADDISAPWDERSRFRQLEIELETFQESLPPDWIYSEGNTSGHKRVGSTTPYVLINVARLLCSVMLHREYLPFIPVSVDKPQGPLDEPTFHADERTPHENAHYWEDSARKCFRAARDIVDLLEACTKANVLPETPLVAFGSWQTAFVGKITCIIVCFWFAKGV
ncbi:hypothetical protein CC78DRAFT_107252 [Lojkania enalia]|uniref:Xylanolytic transcriptional activator regulatory domain-containing protein n=1 Tax=Lojkania enalia TaxID=147567 RepID=A0A9P4KCL7_9PLEO|nr:hypothetical protein CC78DRAFT_107252 [Didymosphaeria enalia]